MFRLPPTTPQQSHAGPRTPCDVATAEPELEAFQVELRAWETVYNTVRPHQALGYLTPAEYLASLGIDV